MYEKCQIEIHSVLKTWSMGLWQEKITLLDV